MLAHIQKRAKTPIFLPLILKRPEAVGVLIFFNFFNFSIFNFSWDNLAIKFDAIKPPAATPVAVSGVTQTATT